MNCLRAAREARRALLEGVVEADFRLLVVWTNTIKSDDAAGAGSAAALFDDPRVRQFHDPERRAGRLFAPVIGMPSMREVAAARGVEPQQLEVGFGKGYVYGEAAVFDTVFFFPPDAEWTGDAPPKPAGWVTQLDPAMFLVDAERFRWGEAMGDEMARLADVLFAQQRAAASAPAPAAAPAAETVFESPLELSLGDLLALDDRCVVALGEAEPGGNGRVRLLASADGRSFAPLGLLEQPGVDLRDPRLSATPDGRLLLCCEASDPEHPGRRTLLAVSLDGAQWRPVGPPAGLPEGAVLRGLAWRGESAHALADLAGGGAALFRSPDGLTLEPAALAPELPPGARAAGLAYDASGALALLLGDPARPDHALLVRARDGAAEVREVPCGLLGAAPLPRPDGRLLAGARDGERGAARVLRLSPDGACEQVLALAHSAGAGRVALLERAGELWIAYCADAEGGSALCVARADLARF